MKILNEEQLLNWEILDGDFTVVTLNVPLKWSEIYFRMSSIVRCKVYAHGPNFVHIWQINYLTENLCILHIKKQCELKIIQLPPTNSTKSEKRLKILLLLGQRRTLHFQSAVSSLLIENTKSFKACDIPRN
jgi:hypothetical protein